MANKRSKKGDPRVRPQMLDRYEEIKELYPALGDQITDLFKELPLTREGHWGTKHLPIVDQVTGVLSPRRVLEIGLNAGHSAALWLAMDPMIQLTSIDIGAHSHVPKAVELLTEAFGDRFKFIKSNSLQAWPLIEGKEFDLVIVDGGHSHKVCLNDLQLALRTGARYVVVDDYKRIKAVRDAVSDFQHMLKPFPMVKLREWTIGEGVVLFEFNQDMPKDFKPGERPSRSQRKAKSTPATKKQTRKTTSKQQKRTYGGPSQSAIPERSAKAIKTGENRKRKGAPPPRVTNGKPRR